MLYHVATHVKYLCPFLDQINPLIIRAVMGLIMGLGCSLLLGKWFISSLQHWLKSAAREWLPERHKQKGIMPTMGGVFILAAVIIGALLLCDLTKPAVWIVLICLIGFGIIGGIDDWFKIRYQQGITATHKIRAQWSVAAFVASLVIWWQHVPTTLILPKLGFLSLGLFFIAWIMFILVGTSNAVNLTDGLDGLAIGSLIPNFAVFAIIAYLNAVSINSSPWSGELAVMGALMAGACAGFWWYNRYPARIFMGDVGSLSLGAGLALMAIMTKHELFLVITGGIFVTEVLSVILQVLSYKYRGKRIFKMAPLHHHFELIGWPETTITWYFSGITTLLCLLVLIIVKRGF